MQAGSKDPGILLVVGEGYPTQREMGKLVSVLEKVVSMLDESAGMRKGLAR